MYHPNAGHTSVDDCTREPRLVRESKLGKTDLKQCRTSPQLREYTNRRPKGLKEHREPHAKLAGQPSSREEVEATFTDRACQLSKLLARSRRSRNSPLIVVNVTMYDTSLADLASTSLIEHLSNNPPPPPLPNISSQIITRNA